MRSALVLWVALAACGDDDATSPPRSDAGAGDGAALDARDSSDDSAPPPPPRTDATVPAPDAGPVAPGACETSAPPPGFHVSPTGLPDGDGSEARPWDIATAMRPHPSIGAGDVVYLHGGTYAGPIVAKVEGTAEAPVVVRSYPGEWAVLDGAGSEDSILQVYRSHAVYRDLEITDSTPHTRAPRVSATWFEGTDIALVNVVIHDTGNVAMYEEAPDLEVYGCLIYAVGFDDPDPAARAHGHNVYVQNDTGTKLIADNVVFNGYSFGIHAYAESGSSLRGMSFVGNVLFGSGAAAAGTDGAKDNLLIGGTEDVPASGIVVSENLGWTRPVGERSVRFGYGGVTNEDITLEGNYLVGETLFDAPWSSVAMTGNTFVGPVSGTVDPSAFPDNSYLSAPPTETRVFVRPNRYEPGRAHVVVYNWGALDAVDVDVSAVLAPGTPFELRRAQDYFGAPVLSGTYDGAPLRVPISGAPPAQPIGSPDAIDPSESTGRDFDVFVLRAACP